VDAAFLSLGDGVSGSLGDEVGLELGHGAEDGDEQAAGRRRCVNGFADAVNGGAASIECMEEAEELEGVAGQAVEAQDDQMIAGAEGGYELIQDWSFCE
jgi:hypothetical protein